MTTSPSKRPIPYYQRILAYCEAMGIEVPKGFHLRSAYKYAVIDTTELPHKLHAITWYIPSQVTAFVEKHFAQDRQCKVLDFKSCRELQSINRKFKKGEPFACKGSNEPLTL